MGALLIVIYLVAVVITTAIFAISLFSLEDIRASSFKELGFVSTLTRCAAIVIVASMINMIPYGWLLAVVVWFVGIMFLFQKTFLQTLVLTILNNIVTVAVAAALNHLFISVSS